MVGPHILFREGWKNTDIIENVEGSKIIKHEILGKRAFVKFTNRRRSQNFHFSYLGGG